MSSDWMAIAEVARALGVHRATALRHVRAGTIPGGELLYKLDDGRERWRVSRDAFRRWRAASAANAANGSSAAD